MADQTDAAAICRQMLSRLDGERLSPDLWRGVCLQARKLGIIVRGCAGVHRQREIKPSLVGRNLKRLREEAGLTQRELVARVGMGQTTLGEIERGRNVRPLADTLARLARALGVTVDVLLQEETGNGQGSVPEHSGDGVAGDARVDA